MTDQPVDLVSALHELDACKATIAAMSEVMAAQRDLLIQSSDTLNSAIQTIGALNEAISLHTAAIPAKRGKGRPRKVTDDRWMLDAFSKMKAEFIASNKFAKPTDTAVLNWYFEKVFSGYGLRVSKVKSAAYQGKLKRFKNRLGAIRRTFVKIPIK